MVRSPKACLPAPLPVRFLPFTSPQLSCPMPFACRRRIPDASVWHSPVPYGPKKEGMAEVRGKKDAMPPY